MVQQAAQAYRDAISGTLAGKLQTEKAGLVADEAEQPMAAWEKELLTEGAEAAPAEAASEAEAQA